MPGTARCSLSVNRKPFPLGFMPLKQSWGNLGLELSPHWSLLDAGNAQVQLASFHLNGVYQRPLPIPNQITARRAT